MLQFLLNINVELNLALTGRMNRMVVFIVLGLIFLVVILYFIIRPIEISTTMKKGPFKLSSVTNALETSDFPSQTLARSFVKEGQGSFQCFVMLDALSRTGAHVDCGTGTGQNKPNCETGLYPVCTCTTINDCNNCNHNGYQRVFTIHGIYTLEVMNVPDASRPNGVAAQLTVRTNDNKSGSQVTEVETISLPPIDRQKWVMITIAKEGRRIDVYYNNSLVLSKKMLSAISLITNNTPLIIGDPLLSGQIGGLTFLPNRQSINDVSSTYAKATNTRGDPAMFLTTPTALTYDVEARSSNSIASGLCLGGSCLSLPKLGAPDISSYPNIFNINTSKSGVPFTTQYA